MRNIDQNLHQTDYVAGQVKPAFASPISFKFFAGCTRLLAYISSLECLCALWFWPFLQTFESHSKDLRRLCG